MLLRLFLLLATGLIGCGPIFAQDLGWLFGQPSEGRHHRRPKATFAEVPLPVPRPEAIGPTIPAADPTRETQPGGRSTDAAPSAAAAPTLSQPETRDGVSLPTTPPPPPAKPADLASPAASPKTEGVGIPPVGAKSAVEPAKPAVAPSGATTAFDPRVPAPDDGCAARLTARGVVTTAAPLAPQPDPRCTVSQPVHLLSAALADGSIVTFPEKPTLACITADAFSAYVHDLLAPLARGTWGVGVTDIWTGPGLECRSRDHVFGAKLSAHGQGLAVDIAQLKLSDGRTVAVGEPKTDRERDFETAARAGGCGYFHTVLGPGSDSYHRTHWHFDLEVRGREGDSKYCK